MSHCRAWFFAGRGGIDLSLGWLNRSIGATISPFSQLIMATETPQDVPLAPSTTPTPEAAPGVDVRQLDRSLDRAAELVREAIAEPPNLDEVAWQLKVAQWDLGRQDSFDRQWPRQTAIVIASAATITYLTYRLIWTLNWSSMPAGIFSVALLAAEAYAGISLGLYFFQVWRLAEPPARRPTALRTVDVFVTTYNEDVSLLRGTLSACLDMDYPHTTYVLDDGARETVRQLADELGVRYLTRTDRTHAKAGNVNNALRQTDGEFVIVLDADHLPYRHFITRLIGYFDDPRMGFVQVPHTTYNLDNFMGHWRTASKAYWEDVRIFFEAVQLGKNRYSVACFCGSAAIFRRKALEEVGLFATETITEDMHTGMRINAAGWKSIAISEEMVVGLAPDDAATFASQRLRWGEGNLSVLAYDNPLTMKGLTLAGRINYIASIASWTMGPARLFLYLTPLVMLLTGIAPVADMSVAYFAIVGSYLVTVWTAVKMASNGCGKLIGIEMAMMASFHLQLKAIWRAAFYRRRQEFVVTRKSHKKRAGSSGLHMMWPQAALVAVSVVAVSWAASRVLFGLSGDYLGLTIGSGLAMYHSWLALCVLGRAVARHKSSGQWRHPICLAVDYSLDDERRPAVSVEFNENGCHLLTWQPVETGRELSVTFHSPVGETTCLGQVASSTPLGHRKPFAYLCNIVFEQAEASQRDRESDELRGIILKYVVPVVTMTHRIVRQGTRSLPEELSGDGDFPLPVSIDPNQPNMGVQRSVALSINRRGFLAAMPVSCVVDSIVQATLTTPFGPITTEVEVGDVETMRLGTAIVYQHEFHWRDASRIRRLVSAKGRWKKNYLQAASRARSQQPSTASVVVAALVGYLLAVTTVFCFSQLHRTDILLAQAANQPPTTAQAARVTAILDSLSTSSSIPTDQLLRAYQAATAINDDAVAAKLAGRLADRPKGERFSWLLTRARHLVRAKEPRLASAAFDQLVADPALREMPLEQQADVYIEAARAAIAVKNYDEAVDRYMHASNLEAPDKDQAEEFLGVLIAAKQTRLAIQVLRQLDRSDRVLRRIIDVYEMAGQAEKATPELEELYRRHPDDAAVVLRLAELAVVRRDFVAGVAYYRVLHRLEPANDTATKKLAETLLLEARQQVAAGNTTAAGKLFDESFGLEPPDDKVKTEYAGFLASTGRLDEALALLTPPHDVDSKRQLAAILEMRGDNAESLRILRDLAREQPPDEQTERSIARLLLATHQYEAAAVHLAELLDKYPNDRQLQREFIDAVAASDNVTDSLRRTMAGVFRQYQASEFASLDAKGFERLGDSLRRLGMLEEARVALDRAIAEYPTTRRLRYYLAQTLGSLGRYEDAEQQYKILLGTQGPHN